MKVTDKISFKNPHVRVIFIWRTVGEFRHKSSENHLFCAPDKGMIINCYWWFPPRNELPFTIFQGYLCRDFHQVSVLQCQPLTCQLSCHLWSDWDHLQFCLLGPMQCYVWAPRVWAFHWTLLPYWGYNWTSALRCSPRHWMHSDSFLQYWRNAMCIAAVHAEVINVWSHAGHHPRVMALLAEGGSPAMVHHR